MQFPDALWFFFLREWAGLTRECNPEPSKGFVAESSGLRDGSENLAALDSFDADMNVICVFGQLGCFNP
jgi:hypothetical protein